MFNYEVILLYIAKYKLFDNNLFRIRILFNFALQKLSNNKTVFIISIFRCFQMLMKIVSGKEKLYVFILYKLIRRAIFTKH